MSSKTHQKLYRSTMHVILTNQVCSLLDWNWFVINQQGQAERKSGMWFWRLFQAHYFFLSGSSFQEHGFWALRTKLMLKMRSNVGGGFLLKQCLSHQGNITVVVFPKWLKLSVISCAYSALAAFEIRLAYDSSLKSQKPCWGFSACLGSLLGLAQGLLVWSWQSFSAFLYFCLVYISSF